MAESAIVAAVRARVARGPERAALVSGEASVRYAELERRSAAAAAQVAGHARGDVVGLLLPNTPAFVWSLLGALWAGKTVAVLPTIAPPPLLKAMAAETGIKTVLTSAALAPRLAETETSCLPVTENAGEVASTPPLKSRTQAAALLLYTSGTTGRPKAVALSDENILANAAGSRDASGLEPDEVMLAILPLFHAYGLTVTLLLPLLEGGTVVLQEGFAPRTVLRAVQQRRVTALVAVPSQYRLLAKEPSRADVSSLRLCIAGAERLPEVVAQDFEARFGRPLLEGYGTTEAAPAVSMNPPRANRPGSVGRPLPNLRVTLREEGCEVTPGEQGEVWVEGPSVMLGYYNRPQATAQKLVEGALRTGDRGFLDRDGYLHLAGRADDLIKLAGEKIYPAKVEAALERIAAVEEAAVLELPDEKHGAVLCAFVQLRAGRHGSEAELRGACREHLEGVKVPRRIVMVEQLPRTASGKIDKRRLVKS
ncbi:MAG: class I adenylate-forming enzyme family protein [Terriglobia bacterium]